MTVLPDFFPLLQAAAAGAGQVAQAASQFETNKELGVTAGQLPIAFWVVWILEKIKKSEKIPWIHDNSNTLNRIIGIVGATLASAGINWKVEGAILAGQTITITLPALGSLIHFFIFDAARSYGVQQVFYRIITAAQAPTPQTPLASMVVRTDPTEAKR